MRVPRSSADRQPCCLRSRSPSTLNGTVIAEQVQYNRRRLDKPLYRLRYRIECMLHSLKRFRAIASRYEKTATTFLAVLHIACAILWLN